jgi:hypothetical protein
MEGSVGLGNFLRPGRLAAIAAACAILVITGVVLVTTAPGAAVIAGARCVGQLLKFDRASYQACFDFEREQILEERARRHSRFDE